MFTKEWLFEATGTSWCIQTQHKLSPEIELQIHHCIQDFESYYSRFLPHAELLKICQKPGTYIMRADAERLFSLYEQLYQSTKGGFTPLIGDTLAQLGYDSSYSLKAKTAYSPDKWDDALHYQFPNLTIKKPVTLDFGAAGKGYLVDLVSEVLIKNQIDSFCIDAGGDMLYRNKETASLSIGLEDPTNTKKIIGVATIYNQSICGSASNKRSWEGFHHIINPHTLTSPLEIVATWVIAEETIIADALATCLFLVSPQVLASSYSFEYLIMYKDRSIQKSLRFPVELFT